MEFKSKFSFLLILLFFGLNTHIALSNDPPQPDPEPKPPAEGFFLFLNSSGTCWVCESTGGVCDVSAQCCYGWGNCNGPG